METVHSQGAATIQIQGFPWVIFRALLERENFHTCTLTIQAGKRELTSHSCPLPSAHTPWPAHTSMHKRTS